MKTFAKLFSSLNVTGQAKVWEGFGPDGIPVLHGRRVHPDKFRVAVAWHYRRPDFGGNSGAFAYNGRGIAHTVHLQT